ncbi:hypothetical protein [Methylogaea oryzae]|uniref:2TM domain-containing protein n=2 Tax=Methylogaea oryzae TaxID=1295382 RepID=A0A8D4VQA9_9GAMM|nr:hypothetical protein [Methylogaea oryzae]BBL72093.1 hypothetical protein MoryE10_26990 [Methylogaea oryzae]
MSKRNRNKKTSAGHSEQRRQQLEWLYSEANEQKLEKLRNTLIFVWLMCCFAAVFLLTDQEAIVVWSGGAGVLLVLAYQVWSLWLDKVVEDRIDEELGVRHED